jgi:Sortase domain
VTAGSLTAGPVPAGARRRRPPLLGLAGLGVYGGVTALTGVLVAIGFGPAPPTAPSLADGTLGRQVTAAPMVPAAGETTSTPGAGRVVPWAIPPANLARSQSPVTPFRPLVLALPSGATAPVLNSGLHPDGSLVIPDDPATVGWWNGGALAGDAYGSIVIAGHVDSARYGLGVMSQLKTLKLGQVVELRAGRRRMQYRVTARRSLPQAELAAEADAFRQDIAPRLVLITCGGAFDPVRHRYQDNLIIFATPLTSP